MIRVILFDRDGTLIADKRGDRRMEAVELMPQARETLDLVRNRGLRIGVVTNQSAVGEGTITVDDVDAVHAQIETLAGKVDGWFVCAHTVDDDCGCRKPAPGLILQAARQFGVPTGECAVIGDIGSDIEAAAHAGAAAVLVPTPVTRPDEIASAPAVAWNLLDAVRMVLP